MDEDMKKAIKALQFIYKAFENGHSFDPWDIRARTEFGEDVLNRLVKKSKESV